MAMFRLRNTTGRIQNAYHVPAFQFHPEAILRHGWYSVLKGFVSVFAETHFDGVSGIPQLSLETVGLLLVFGFCHILCSFT